MPLQNRVDPFGLLHAVPERGAWMGNRGKLHDNDRRVRWFQMTTRWIICELEFRGIRREVMKPGRYTELFFMDEATALAAGHRPCNLCRRSSARQFLELTGAASLGELDKVLHPERMQNRRLEEDWRSLPNGAMIGWLHQSYMVWDESLHLWSFTGYRRVDSIAEDIERRGVLEAPALKAMGTVFRESDVELLTPPTTIEVLRAGYPAQAHPSLKTGPS